MCALLLKEEAILHSGKHDPKTFCCHQTGQNLGQIRAQGETRPVGWGEGRKTRPTHFAQQEYKQKGQNITLHLITLREVSSRCLNYQTNRGKCADF